MSGSESSVVSLHKVHRSWWQLRTRIRLHNHTFLGPLTAANIQLSMLAMFDDGELGFIDLMGTTDGDSMHNPAPYF